MTSTDGAPERVEGAASEDAFTDESTSEAASTDAADAGVVSWSVAPTDTRVGRLCTYVLTGYLGGFLVLVLALMGVAALSSALSGDWRTLALAAVLVVLAGPISAIPLVVFLDADQRADLEGPLGRIDLGELHPLGVLASALVGAPLIVAGFAAGLPGVIAVFVGPVLLPIFAFTVLAPEGEVDLDAGALTLYDTTHSLADLTSIRTYAVADLVLVRPRFAPRPGGRDAPFLFTMQSADYDRARSAFADGVAADAETTSSQSAGERVAISVAGIVALALAGGLVALGTTSATDGSEVLYGIASMPTVLGLFLLWLAARSNG